MNAVKQKLNHYVKYMSDKDALLLFEWVNQNIANANKEKEWPEIVEVESDEYDSEGNRKTLVLPTNVYEYLKHLVKCAKETLPVTAIYLFGSYATGNYRENSDLDVYIVTPDKSKSRTKHAISVSLARGLENYIATDLLVGYEDDFEDRKNMINTVENEVNEKGVNIYAFA